MGAILDSLNACFLKVDRNYVIVEANSRALGWLRMRREDVVGRGYKDVFRKSPMKMLENAVEATIFTDHELRSHDRPDRWVELHTHPARDGAIVFFKDISEQKSSLEKASRATALLKRTLDALSAHVVVLDKTGTIVASNPAWRRFAVAQGLVGSTTERAPNYLSLLAAPPAGCPDAGRIAELLSSLLVARRRAGRLTYAWRCEGRTLWFQLSAARFESDGETCLVVVNEDITAVKEAQQVLGDAAQRASAVKDKERKRIAGELHDSTAQHLVAAGLNLMGLKRRVEADKVSLSLVREIDASLDAVMKEVRTFTYLLHPPDLGKDGLRTTLVNYVHGFDKRTGLKTRLKLSAAADTLPPALQRTIFLIVQEALANVHRHAAASRASVDLRCLFQRLHLVVRDDGRGVIGGACGSKRTARRRPGRSAGIASIRARLRQFQGELRLEPALRGGTKLHAMVPLRTASIASDPARSGNVARR